PGMVPASARPSAGRTAPERSVVWSNANVGEALPGVATPMTWSIIEGFSRRGFLQAFGALGLSVPEEYRLVGNIHGRVYLNLSEFMSVASGIPFLTPEILARLAGGVDPRLMAGAYAPSSSARFLGQLPSSLLRVARAQLLAPTRARSLACRFRQQRDRFLQDLSSRSDRALYGQLQEQNELFNSTGELLLTCSSNALASYVAVQLLLSLGGERTRRLEGELFTGLEGLASAAPGIRLLELAHQARELGLAELFAAAGCHDRQGFVDWRRLLGLLAVTPGAAPFREAFAGFLGEFGHRAVREAELSVPRWREDPSFPLQVIASHLAGSDLPDPRGRQVRQAQARQAATAEAMRLLPRPLAPLLRLLLPVAQEAARLREMLRSCVTEAIGLYRHLLLEVGRRLARQGQLHAIDDVFFLTLGEVEQLLAAGPQPLAARVLERRARYAADLATPDLSPTFRTGAPPAGSVMAATVPEDDEPATWPGCAGQAVEGRGGEVLLQGLGCSTGRVEGVVRVLVSPREGHRLQPGEILVARTTDMGWTPLFLVASGLILDLNGPLSHSAVVAREYGLPVVVSTGNATLLLHDGDRVLLDGREGTVRLLALPKSESDVPAPANAAAGEAAGAASSTAGGPATLEGQVAA
ncbi:MAG: hypothetical protein FJ125_13860, partial [Deltaproteobacteria bacterium]|nr:hypothetical protein [Deltaproteobacteria bacterium]